MATNNKKSVVLMPLILAIALVTGMFIGIKLSKKDPNDRIFIYPRNNNKLNNVLNYIEEEYVDSVNKNELIENAIPEILKQLDPHSVYIPASELKKVNEPKEYFPKDYNPKIDNYFETFFYIEDLQSDKKVDYNLLSVYGIISKV